MDHARIAKLFINARKNKVRIAERFHVMENLCFLSRSSSSVLTNFDHKSPPFRLSEHFEKHHVRACAVVRKPREEAAEYQVMHITAVR